MNSRFRAFSRFGAVAACALLVAACGGGDSSSNTEATPEQPPAPPVVLNCGPDRTELRVTKAGDATGIQSSAGAEEGTLRWAILKNNEEPGKHCITLVSPASGEQMVIHLQAELPSITGPTSIKGDWKWTAENKKTVESGNLAGETGLPGVVVDGYPWLDTRILSTQPGGNILGQPTDCPAQVLNGTYGPNVRSLFGAGIKVVGNIVTDQKPTNGNVEIAGFEVRNMCSGIMLLRAHDNWVHDMRVFNNRGAAGILLSGDDETNAGGATVGLNINNLIEDSYILDNGDSMDVARGSDFTKVRRNTFILSPDAINNSEGVEILSTNNGTVQDNYFAGQAEPLQIGGNNHTITGNYITASATAATMSGTDSLFMNNTITGNHQGLRAAGRRITVSQNSIHDNGKNISISGAGGVLAGTAAYTNVLGLYFAAGTAANPTALTLNETAPCADGFFDCDTRQNYPVLNQNTSYWAPGGFRVIGSLTSRPNQAFAVEIFGSHKPGLTVTDNGATVWGDGEVYLGTVNATSDANGVVSFTFLAGTDPLKDGTKTVYFSATATRLSSDTSTTGGVTTVTQAAAPSLGATSQISPVIMLDAP
jgi:3-dehydroshikimate dehydratase